MIAAQTSIKLAKQDANMERYEFSSTKTKTVIVNMSLTPEEASQSMPLLLNSSAIDYSKSETHLGIQRSDDGKATETVNNRINTARRAAYALMGAGLHGMNGTGPVVAMTLINTYVLLALM
jgi:hypothetical protein